MLILSLDGSKVKVLQTEKLETLAQIYCTSVPIISVRIGHRYSFEAFVLKII